MATPNESYPGVEPYTPSLSARRAIIVDVDGTVALLNGRDPYDQTTCSQDLPNWPVIHVVRGCVVSRGCTLLFMSGRPSKCRSDTSVWLQRFVVPVGHPWQLFMRSNGDYRPDWQAKLDLFNDHVRHQYEVLAAFEDRTQAVKLWRQLGITTFQVADGDF